MVFGGENGDIDKQYQNTIRICDSIYSPAFNFYLGRLRSQNAHFHIFSQPGFDVSIKVEFPDLHDCRLVYIISN